MESTKKAKIDVNYRDFNLISDNLCFNRQAFSILVAGVVLITSTSLFSKNNEKNKIPNVNVETAKIVDIVQNSTSLDEIMSSTNEHMDDNLDWLDKLVKLSDRLHNLDLQKRIVGLDTYSQPYEFDINIVTKIIDEFEELLTNPDVTRGTLTSEYIKYNNLISILEACEKSVNGSINNSVYDVLAGYAEMLVKAKALDAYGIDYSKVDKILISEKDKEKNQYTISFIDKKNNEKVNLVVKDNGEEAPKNYLYETLENINVWRAKAKMEENSIGEYNADRNNEIREGINLLKSLTLMECTTKNGGRIAITVKMKTLETMIDMVEDASFSTPVKKIKNNKKF